MAQVNQGSGIGARAYRLRCSGRHASWQAIADVMRYRVGEAGASDAIANAARWHAKSHGLEWPAPVSEVVDDAEDPGRDVHREGIATEAMPMVSESVGALEARVAELEAEVAALDRRNGELFGMLTDTLRLVSDLRVREEARSGAEREAVQHAAMTGRNPRGFGIAGVG